MMLAAEQTAGRLDANRPWPGLDPFPEEASAFFYGREQECDEMFRHIRRDITTLLFGQSGLGKTSLLQAGLFPLLRRKGFLPIRIRLDYAVAAIAPAAQMLATLRQALGEAKLPKCTPIQPNQPLWAYFHQTDLQLIADDGTITPVLVFDQSEEAFTLGLTREGMRGRTQEFLSELADLIENRPSGELEAQFARSPDLVEHYVFDREPYRIVIVLREDYLAALESMRERAPSLGRSRFRLTAMNGRQALDAVIKPGRAIISREVAIDTIRFISQARQEDPFCEAAREGAIETLEVEPSLLSLFCYELNERRLKIGASEITHELVAGSSQTVLQEFYEGAVADQPPALRSFIEQELITKSGFRESMALERARESLRQRGIPPDALEVLVHRRLLRVEERLQVSRIEIIHDLLVEVIRRSRANREQRRSLDQARQSRRLKAITAAVVAVVFSFAVFAAYTELQQRKTVEEQSKIVEEQSKTVEELLRSLANKDPSDAERQWALSAALRSVGEVQLAQGKLSDALASYSEALDIGRSLANKDPSSVQWQTDVVQLLRDLATAGNKPRARLTEALTILNRLKAEGKLTQAQLQSIDQIEAELAKLPTD
jgi:tetratricopeptide (TPR) repeat protein